MKNILIVLVLTVTAFGQSTTNCTVSGNNVNCVTNPSQPRQDFASGFQRSNGADGFANLMVGLHARHERKKTEKQYCSQHKNEVNPMTNKVCK